jgi:hypothetical protein
MKHLNIILPTAIALAVIWTGVALVLQATADSVSSPEKVLQLMAAAPWVQKGAKTTAESRRPYLDQVARNINLLDLEQAQQVRDEAMDSAPDFFLFLSEAEQKAFLQQTLEHRAKTLLKAFNNLSLEERRTMLTRSRAELKKTGRDNGSLDKLVALDPNVFDTILKDGITPYYEAADLEKRRLLAPLIEEMQSRMQGGRKR